MYKNLSSSCDDFTITGSISYNDSKSAIFINNIEYCGSLDENTTYKFLECSLYEVNDNIEKKISSYKDKEKAEVCFEEAFKGQEFSSVVTIDGKGVLRKNGEIPEILRV